MKERTLDCRGRPLAAGGGTRVVGILNVTPDSFFDGGRYAAVEAALAQGRRMAAEGAAMVDVGGQSTRPGFEEISAADEIARVVPIVGALARELEIPISVDTYKPGVARAALAAGGHLLNDVTGFQGDPGMAAVAAEFRCPVILMHNDAGFRGFSGAAMDGLRAFFERSLEIAAKAGVAREAILLDPGIGFSKTHAQNLEILGSLAILREFGLPVVLGVSRKSVIGRTLGVAPAESLEGTLALTALAAAQGVDFVRVHDVLANVRAAAMARAVLDNPSLRRDSPVA